MPSKRQIIEDVLGAIEDEFYRVLTREEFEEYLGAKVTIVYSAKPRLEIDIHELGKPGPKRGQKFKKRVGPRPSALKAIEDTEEF
jgi:hypothetical protein